MTGGQLWSNGIEEHSSSRCLSESPGRSRYMADMGPSISTDQKVGGSNPSERAKVQVSRHLTPPPHARLRRRGAISASSISVSFILPSVRWPPSWSAPVSCSGPHIGWATRCLNHAAQLRPRPSAGRRRGGRRHRRHAGRDRDPRAASRCSSVTGDRQRAAPVQGCAAERRGPATRGTPSAGASRR